MRIWFCKIQTFIFFFLKLFFFFIFTTKNEESLLFWKNLSTWELKKRVKSRLISENTEVETFSHFWFRTCVEAKANWSKKNKNKIKNKKNVCRVGLKNSSKLWDKVFFFLALYILTLLRPRKYNPVLRGNWSKFSVLTDFFPQILQNQPFFENILCQNISQNFSAIFF